MSAFIGEVSFKPVGRFASEEVFVGNFKYGHVFPAGGGYIALPMDGLMNPPHPFYGASKDVAVDKLIAGVGA